MSALTARALSLGLVVAAWTLISHLGKLPLLLWPVIVGVGCFVAAGGGMGGLQKSAAGTVSGVVWALIYAAVAGALGGNRVLDALAIGAVSFAMVFQSRIAMLGFTAGAFIGAATTVAARATGLNGGIRIAMALVIGVVLGMVAERLAEVLQKTRIMAHAGR